MFEKEAEEIANKRCHEIMCFGHCSFNSPKHHRCGEWHREYNCAKEGIEYGYSLAHEEMDYLNQHWKEKERKANEWHYVKDGDLPPVSDSTLLPQLYPVNVAVCVNNNIKVYGAYWDRHNGKFNCLDKVYAWKEMPESPKEIEYMLKELTNLERSLLDNLKEDEKIMNVQVYKDKVVFDIVKPIKEQNERITKENPSEEFIRTLKDWEKDSE